MMMLPLLVLIALPHSPAVGQVIQHAEAASALAALRVSYGERHGKIVDAKAKLKALSPLPKLSAEDARVACTLLKTRRYALLRDDADRSTLYGEQHPERLRLKARIELLGIFKKTYCKR